jgi:hypothetical protein
MTPLTLGYSCHREKKWIWEKEMGVNGNDGNEKKKRPKWKTYVYVCVFIYICLMKAHKKCASLKTLGRRKRRMSVYFNKHNRIQYVESQRRPGMGNTNWWPNGSISRRSHIREVSDEDTVVQKFSVAATSYRLRVLYSYTVEEFRQ